MTLMRALRCHVPTTPLRRAAVVAFAWLALLAPPCVMGLSGEAASHEVAPTLMEGAGHHAGSTAEPHDCPHCPPASLSATDCGDCRQTDAVKPPRPDNAPDHPALSHRAPDVTVPAAPPAFTPAAHQPPPIRGGPRLHLLHAHFDE